MKVLKWSIQIIVVWFLNYFICLCKTVLSMCRIIQHDLKGCEMPTYNKKLVVLVNLRLYLNNGKVWVISKPENTIFTFNFTFDHDETVGIAMHVTFSFLFHMLCFHILPWPTHNHTTYFEWYSLERPAFKGKVYGSSPESSKIFFISSKFSQSLKNMTVNSPLTLFIKVWRHQKIQWESMKENL